MERIGNIKSAEAKVLSDVNALLDEIRGIVSVSPSSAMEGVELLAQVRDVAYEDLNQIPHEYMILRAARWLVDNDRVTPSVEWSWNPRQTGGADEPDLQASENFQTLISGEITTSRRPIGTIADRMKQTLEKLSGFEGEKFYFVRTRSMAQRAEGYVQKSNWDIEVVCLEDDL